MPRVHLSPHMLTLAAGVNSLPLLTTIAAAFAAAWVLGLITHRLGLSPIVGYLLAGIAIGPHTPGFAGDVALAHQLAEIGVILLMFGVGLHFKIKDLVAVRSIAVPGAIGQSLIATVATVAVFHFFGWSMRSGIVLGIAMSVASTVVLLRVLMDRRMLHTSHGHAAVGWLIVEDILTVLALVMVPIFAIAPVDAAAPAVGGAVAGTVGDTVGQAAATSGFASVALVGWAILKLAALAAILLIGGARVIPWVLARVAKLRSAELFTLTVLVLSIAIAVGAASVFGASVALGAFLAGIVVAQSPASHQAAADALPMRDAFAVLFFVSIGMLFDPSFLLAQPLLVCAGVFVVLLVKPIAALALVAICGYPGRTAITVAIGLAQIGEFSFILAQSAREHNLLPEEGMQVLVATAIISITFNPLLFRSLPRFERVLQRTPWLWRLLNARHDRRAAALNQVSAAAIAAIDAPLTVIVGYGPVGRVVDALLRDAKIETVVVDMNIETVQALTKSGRRGIYGDAARREILEEAGIRHAAHLVVTLPHAEDRIPLVSAARELNPDLDITVRARYLAEREPLERAGASRVILEEGEAGVALARYVLGRRGIDRASMEKLLTAIRRIWGMDA